jgi:hypothetical protein
MISWLLLLGLVLVLGIAATALGVRRSGRRLVMIPPDAPPRPERPHRQAIHHFASGALPPWR